LRRRFSISSVDSRGFAEKEEKVERMEMWRYGGTEAIDIPS